MDRLDLAQRRYHEILGEDLLGMEPSEQYWRFPTDALLAWIDNYVLPAIEEVYRRPQFRNHATWPQRELVSGAKTLQREAVQRVDRALVAEGKALSRLTRNKLVAQALEEMTRPPTEEPEAMVRVINSSVDGSEYAPIGLDSRKWIPYYVAQTSNMSRKDWTDLVCADDYFVPVGGGMRKTPPPKDVTEGEFVVSLSFHLFQVGDSVTRCMMQRIRSRNSFLHEARQVIYEAVRATGRPYTSQVDAENEAHQELDESHADLQRICLTGADARIREACITLVQVYAEFHPSPDLDWLGTSDGAFQCFKGTLRHNIKNTRELETVERIAAALGDLKHLYRASSPEQSDIDAAIATGGLVLIDASREAYWEGAKIDQDWHRHRKPWKMLWRLAINRRSVSPVHDIDLYKQHVQPSTMYNRWLRLKELLPSSLSCLVSPGTESATYGLALPNNEIHLFESRDPDA